MWPYPHNRNRNPFSIPGGAKRHFVTVQTLSTTTDATGGQVPSDPTPVLSCMAAINTLSEREAYQTGQFSSQVTHRVSIDWPGPTPVLYAGMQVVFGMRLFQVQAIDNVQERNRTLHLMCLEIDGGQ
jgi:SPP1 family predicted phage head-tail adaptor